MFQTAEKTHSVSTLPIPVSLHMLTRILAYFHKHQVNRSPGKRFMPLNHARRVLSLCYPPHFRSDQINSWHQDNNFLNSIALLIASNLLLGHGPHIIPSPQAHAWLSAPVSDRQKTLTEACQSPDFSQFLRTHSSRIHNLDSVVYKLVFLKPPSSCQAQSAPSSSPFTIPACNRPDWLWFDLFQIGKWDNDAEQFLINQNSITNTNLNIISLTHVRWIIEKSNNRSLAESELMQLNKWFDHRQTYTLNHAAVLSVKHPSDLEPILKHKKLRQSIIQQYSPRDIAIQQNALPLLQKELARQKYHLELPATTEKLQEPLRSAEWNWLGLRVLTELRQFIPNAPAPSGSLLNQLANQLPLETHSDLEAQAKKVIDNIRQAIQGKDQFFPAQTDPPQEWTIIIEEAIEKERAIQLSYQSLGDVSPRTRVVWPHHIWHTADLTYFSGWCELAGTELAFRLDRASQVTILD